MNSKKPLYLGLVGLPASGKTTASNHLETAGFTRITLSFYIQKLLIKQKKEVTRKKLQDAGNQLRKKHGFGVLGHLATKEIKKLKLKRSTIDGIRHPMEIKELKNALSPFFVIAIKADSKTRFSRLKSNPKNKNIKTLKDFKFYEGQENQAFKSGHGLQVNTTLKKADLVIKNNQSLKHFYNSLDKAVQSL